MDLVKVDSSMIYAVGYDPDTQTLEVVFTRTGVYIYEGVPQEVYDGLLSADSKGSYMRGYIIDSYPTRKLK